MRRIICWILGHDYSTNWGWGAELFECKRCGKGGLHWEEVDSRYVLYDAKMKKHVCPPVDASDDFDVVT